MPYRLLSFITAGLVCTLAPITASAQDDGPEPGWYDTAELTYVSTGGNSEGETLGFKNSLRKVMEGALFTLEAGALRVESTSISRFARRIEGGEERFAFGEDKTSEVTAENYHLRGRYDRYVTNRLFWHLGASWERNEFAGFTERITGAAGIGNLWWQEEDGHFRTDYGLTWTRQDDIVDNLGIDDSFFGLRLGYDYLNQLTGTTSFSSILIVDANLDETDDLRADFTNAVAVSMTERLALKASLQLLYDHLPALVAVPVLGSERTVLAELDELDSLFTVALVIDF